ncbi:MAG TPA: alpha/beta hydrolase [Qipengyuania sp.]|nr:alpha/beta hydrolase [Qipengyuania sp.]
MTTAAELAPIDRRTIPPHARESVWTAGDGHAIRCIDWPGDVARPRGSILFLPGRGDNYEKYLETLEEWHRAGWRVTGADWRGQAGSGRLGQDATTGHVGDFAVWLDDIAELWREWRATTPGPHVLAAHSMGGHLALRAVAEGRVRADAMVLVAPMLGMAGPPLPLAMLQAVAGMMTRIGHPARPAWKWSEKPGEIPAAREALLTHDSQRYADELWWREHRPELVMGPGSWGWVERAYASSRALFAPGVLEHVTTPTLMLATTADRLVKFAAIERACSRMPHCELVRFGNEARHEILREVDAVRGRAMTEIARFLDTAAPRSATP